MSKIIELHPGAGKNWRPWPDRGPIERLEFIRLAEKQRVETLLENNSPSDYLNVDVAEARGFIEGIEYAMRILKGGIGR